MDGRRALTVDPTLDGVPHIRRHPLAFHRGPRRGPAARSQKGAERSFLAGRLSDTWAAVLGLGWPVAFVAITAMEPAPADPNAHVPLIVDVGAMVFLTTLALTCLTAATRSRIAAPARRRHRHRGIGVRRVMPGVRPPRLRRLVVRRTGPPRLHDRCRRGRPRPPRRRPLTRRQPDRPTSRCKPWYLRCGPGSLPHHEGAGPRRRGTRRRGRARTGFRASAMTVRSPR